MSNSGELLSQNHEYGDTIMSEEHFDKKPSALELADDFLLNDNQKMDDAIDMINRLYAALEDEEMRVTLLCLELNKLVKQFSSYE